MSESEATARCAAYEEDLSAWLDGELDASGAAVVRDHVEDCARCTARVEALRAVDTRLRAIAGAAPSPVEAERLARLRARLATQQSQLQPLPRRAGEPAEADAPALPPAAQADRPAAPARRRRLPAALLAVAAALVAALALPRLLEQTRPVDEARLAQGEAPARARTEAPAAAPPKTAPAARLAARQPLPSDRPFGASAPDAAGAAAETARRDASEPVSALDEIDLALALDELDGVDPRDLAVIERLDALERMADANAGDGGSP
jgi:anti-sigma factor RsiW